MATNTIVYGILDLIKLDIITAQEKLRNKKESQLYLNQAFGTSIP